MPLPKADRTTTTTSARKEQLAVLILSVCLFVASLFCVAFSTKAHVRTAMDALIGGAIGVLAGGAAISWLANPALLLSWLLLANGSKKAWVFGLAAAGFALFFLRFDTVLEDEAGHYGPIVILGTGYWLWLASCLAALLGGVLTLLRKPAAS